MDSDFEGYMETLQMREAEQQRRAAMLEQHEIWRQTTWSGWMVRQLQAIGSHFAPFFIAISDAVEGNDGAAVVITLLLRILAISAFIAALYAFAKIVNMLIGAREIVIEEEIIVEEDEEDAKGDDQQVVSRTSKLQLTERKKRGKKDR